MATTESGEVSKVAIDATSDFFRRNIVRMTELVYGKAMQDLHYPFALMLHEVRAFVKYCEDHGFDDIDYLERLVMAFYSPHPSRFQQHHFNYLLSVIAQDSALEGRVVTIEKFVASKYGEP